MNLKLALALTIALALTTTLTYAYPVKVNSTVGVISGLSRVAVGGLNIAYGETFQAVDLELNVKYTAGKEGLKPTPTEVYETSYSLQAAFKGQLTTGLRWLNPELGVDLYSRNQAEGNAQLTYHVYASNQHPITKAIHIPKATWP